MESKERTLSSIADANRLPSALRDPLMQEIALVTAITIVAAVLRLWRIGTVPLGLHGDEAWTGLDAQRILDEGWIGPYVISALGQPTGPLYYVAALFTFLPEDTATIRTAMAVTGVATIPVSYMAFRTMFDRTTATLAIVILAGLMWHLHLSRTGFMVTTQPLVQMLVLWALFEGLRRRSAGVLLVAGILYGLGVYAYNAYLVFMPVPLFAIAITLFRERHRDDRVILTWGAAIFVSSAVIVSLPLIDYVLNDWDTYRLHQEVVGVTSTDEWADAGIAGKADILWDRGGEWLEAMWRGDRPDYGDGLADAAPPVHPLVFGLAIAGLLMAAWRWRSTPHLVVIAAVLLLPLGALLTAGDGLFRRTLGITPFIAVLAAMPLAWLWTQRRWPWATCTAVVVAAVFPGVIATREYFGEVQNSVAVRYVYPFELDAAARYMDDLPDGTMVYYYSDRWGMEYETVRFLAPDVRGEDRTGRYLDSGPPPIDELDLSNEHDGPVAYVFLGAYMAYLEGAARQHPGGVIAEGRRGGDELVFRAYLLDGGGE